MSIMFLQNVTSEWNECRASISRFDGYLFRLRLSVFTVFSLVLSALIGSSSIEEVSKIFESSSTVLFVYATLSTYMLSIYILDRYYERMLMIAVYRASYIETFRLENFKIGLTTEIEFQKEKILQDSTRKKRFFSKVGFKGSEMVNIIYAFLYLLISTFSFSVIFQNDNFRYNTNVLLFFTVLLGFILLGCYANTFLVEPKKLIKLRSEAVKSPVIISKDEIVFLVNRIAEQIRELYGDKHITIVSILNGARPFTNDLMKKLEELNVKFEIHLIRIESTKGNHHLNTMEFIFGNNNNFKDKNVLVIDTGKTVISCQRAY